VALTEVCSRNLERVSMVDRYQRMRLRDQAVSLERRDYRRLRLFL
jgi:hypothetical protein